MPKKQTSTKNKSKVSNNQSSTNFLIVMVILLIVGVLGYFGIKNYTNLLDDNKSASATSYTRIWTNRSSTTVSACNGYSDGRYFLKVYGTKSTSRVMNVRLFRIKNGSHFLGPYHRWSNPATYFYSRSSSAGSVKFILNTPIGSPSVQRTIPFTSITAC